MAATDASLQTALLSAALALPGLGLVTPSAHAETARELEELGCSLDVEGGPGIYESGPFGEASGRPIPVAVENFHALKQRQTTEVLIPVDAVRVNLLNWDGKGALDE